MSLRPSQNVQYPSAPNIGDTAAREIRTGDRASGACPRTRADGAARGITELPGRWHATVASSATRWTGARPPRTPSRRPRPTRRQRDAHRALFSVRRHRPIRGHVQIGDKNVDSPVLPSRRCDAVRHRDYGLGRGDVMTRSSAGLAAALDNPCCATPAPFNC